MAIYSGHVHVFVWMCVLTKNNFSSRIWKKNFQRFFLSLLWLYTQAIYTCLCGCVFWQKIIFQVEFENFFFKDFSCLCYMAIYSGHIHVFVWMCVLTKNKFSSRIWKFFFQRFFLSLLWLYTQAIYTCLCGCV